jgi:hypothetical protein
MIVINVITKVLLAQKRLNTGIIVKILLNPGKFLKVLALNTGLFAVSASTVLTWFYVIL